MTKLASDDDDEEEEDWSDVSELQEVDSKRFQSTSDQNGNVDNRSFVKGEWSVLSKVLQLDHIEIH